MDILMYRDSMVFLPTPEIYLRRRIWKEITVDHPGTQQLHRSKNTELRRIIIHAPAYAGSSGGVSWKESPGPASIKLSVCSSGLCSIMNVSSVLLFLCLVVLHFLHSCSWCSRSFLLHFHGPQFHPLFFKFS